MKNFHHRLHRLIKSFPPYNGIIIFLEAEAERTKKSPKAHTKTNTSSQEKLFGEIQNSFLICVICGEKMRIYGVFYFSLSYSSSVTGSSHSLEVFSPGTSKARCANQLSAAAPCQCFTFAGMCITSPGSICTAGFPSS